MHDAYLDAHILIPTPEPVRVRAQGLISGQRPVVIEHRGGLVHIHVHDAHFRMQRALWRSQLVAVHPDVGGTHAKFIAVKARYDAWLADEAAWYFPYGLSLPGQPPIEQATPDTSAPPDVAHEPISAPGPMPRKVAERLIWFLRGGVVLSRKILAEGLGIKASYVAPVVNRMRTYGHEILSTPQGYQLITEAQPRSTRGRLLAILAEGKACTLDTLGTRTGRSRSSVSSHLSRLRGKGFPIIVSFDGTAWTYHLRQKDI